MRYDTAYTLYHLSLHLHAWKKHESNAGGEMSCLIVQSLMTITLVKRSRKKKDVKIAVIRISFGT